MNATTRALNPELFPPSPTDRMLDEHAANIPARTNWKNDGREFQKEIERTAGAYQSRRTASLRKVDPPVRMVGRTQQERRVIFLANPWLDFIGTWTAHHGRMLLVECKSTATHRLPFARSGGLTMEQLSTIKTWRSAGASVVVLWKWANGVCLFTPEMLVAAEGRAEKSLQWESGIRVQRGEGTVIWDFLPPLENAIWPPKSCEQTSQLIAP